MATAEPRKLNRQKLYGEIYGELPNLARYEQDGVQFDAQGREVRPLAEVEELLAAEAKAAQIEEEVKFNAEVEKRVAERLKEKAK